MRGPKRCQPEGQASDDHERPGYSVQIFHHNAQILHAVVRDGNFLISRRLSSGLF
jgi:hypothetical protein